MRKAQYARVAGHTRMAGRGFTLLEVMIVIVIILAIAGLVTVNLMGARKEAGKGIEIGKMQTLKQALKMFEATFYRFPSEEEGLAVLWNKNALPETDQAKWYAFMDERMPNDAWGTPWGYKVLSSDEGGGFDLWSNGPDKEEGTSDDIKLPKATAEEGDGDAEGVAPPPPPSN